MTASRHVAVCCDVQGCIVCTTTAGKSVKAARNALWLGGWARRKKQDICPMHNPKRDDYEQRRTSMEYRRRQPPSSGTQTQTARS